MTVTAPSAQPSAPTPRRGGLRAILTPGWLGIIALAMVFAGACWFVLAPWQYHRHEERSALNAQIERALAAPAVPVGDLLTAAAEPAPESEYRLVTATGRYLPDEQVYVRLRQQNGMVAAEVVLPFQLADGTRILVDRGYVANDDITAGDLPADAPAGEVTITARVSADQPDPSNRPRQEVNGRVDVYGIDSATLLGDAPGARLGFVQLVDGSPGVLSEIGVPDRDAGPFLSYSLQWAVFGVVALLAAGFFAYREVTDPDDDAVPPAAPAAPDGPDADGSATAPDATPAPDAPPPARPRRAKFDKSQLYD